MYLLLMKWSALWKLKETTENNAFFCHLLCYFLSLNILWEEQVQSVCIIHKIHIMFLNVTHTQNFRLPITSLIPSYNQSADLNIQQLYYLPKHPICSCCESFISQVYISLSPLETWFKLLRFRKCKEEPVKSISSKKATKWGVVGECVQSSHNQALMYEDSGVITRSYPSFITLQKDTSALLSLLYSLSCYSSLWSFLLPLPHSYSVTHLFLYHFAAQLQHLLHLFISCFVLFFCVFALVLYLTCYEI